MREPSWENAAGRARNKSVGGCECMQDRIIYDSSELLELLEWHLDQFKEFRFDHKYRELLGETLIQKINTWDSNIRRQKDAPLTLVVCGEFKRGKSSLINAILGEDVVTTDITTETITTNKISYGAHKNEMVLSKGKRLSLSDEELKSEKLRTIMENAPEEVSRLELKRPIEVLKQLTIIDTPGLGDSVKDFSADVEQALAQADAVIYVFSISYPLSVNEQLFVKTVIKPQKYTDLFLVGNMSDIPEDEEDFRRVEAVIGSRLAQVLPGETPIMLSALDERCRQKGVRRPNDELEPILAANFDRFRSRLTELLESKRDCVLPDRIQRLLGGMVQDIRMDLDALKRGLAMAQEQVAAEKDRLRSYKDQKIAEQTQLEAQIDQLITLHYGNAAEWIEDLLRKMEADVDKLREYSAEDIKKYYALFCVETIQEALNRCVEYSTMEIYDELDLISEEITKKMSIKNAAPTVALSFSLQNKTWTRGDNVAFASYMIGLNSTLLGVAVDYVAGGMRQKKISNSQDDLVREIKAQYDGLKSSVFAALSETYKTLGSNAKEQLGIYFEEQLLSLESQTEQSAMVARQDDARKQEIRTAVDALERVLTEIEEALALS